MVKSYLGSEPRALLLYRPLSIEPSLLQPNTTHSAQLDNLHPPQRHQDAIPAPRSASDSGIAKGSTRESLFPSTPPVPRRLSPVGGAAEMQSRLGRCRPLTFSLHQTYTGDCCRILPKAWHYRLEFKSLNMYMYAVNSFASTSPLFTKLDSA